MNRLRLGLLICAVITITVVVLAVPLPTAAEAHRWIADAGPAGPVLYLAAYLVGAVLLVPRPVLTLAGGALFGPIAGTALALLAATMAALVSFLLARLLGQELVTGRLSSHRAVAKLDGLLASHGWLAVVYLRLLPIVPYSVVNYGCGLSSLPTTHFVLGTAIGSLPATILLTTIGGSVNDLSSPTSYVPVAIGVLSGAAVFTGAGPAACRPRTPPRPAARAARRERPAPAAR